MADERPSGADLVAALTARGVRIIVCGQSAGYYDVTTDDLPISRPAAGFALDRHCPLSV